MRHIFPALIAAAPLVAQAPVPATPAGQKLKAWVETVNSGDAARFVAFAKENFAPEFLKDSPPESSAQIFAGLRKRIGELLIHSVEPQDGHNLKVMLANRDQSFRLNGTFTVSTDAPHQITLIRLQGGNQ